MIEKSEKMHLGETDDRVPEILADDLAVLRLFGIGITNRTVIGFTNKMGKRGDKCEYLETGDFAVRYILLFFAQLFVFFFFLFNLTQQVTDVVRDITGVVRVILPLANSSFYICAGELDSTGQRETLIHQGSETYKSVRIEIIIKQTVKFTQKI